MAYAGSAGHVKTRPLLWSFRSDDKNRRDERWEVSGISADLANNDDGRPLIQAPIARIASPQAMAPPHHGHTNY
jgi:hypothetical protein